MKTNFGVGRRGRSTIVADSCDGTSTAPTALTATVSASHLMTEEQMPTNPQKMIGRQMSTRVKRDNIARGIPSRYFNGTFSSFLVLLVILFLQCGSLFLFCYRWFVVLKTDTYQNDSFAQEYFFLILSVIGTSAGFLCGKQASSLTQSSTKIVVYSSSSSIFPNISLLGYSIRRVGNVVQI